MSALRNPGHLAKRVTQTPVLFRNFPTVFRDLGLAGTRWRSAEMTFRMRNGYVVTCPNSDGARFPLYEIFGDDAYVLDELLAGVSPDATVLDVGGQIGSFSLAVAEAGPGLHVEIYEASPTSADYIARNITTNGLDSRLRVHRAAMAGEEGEFTFFDSGTASGHNGLTAPEWMRDEWKQGQAAGEVTVPARPFDAAVAAAPSPVEVVKMDIEGAEYDVILKSSPASWTTVKKVVMEYHPVSGHSLDELLAFLGDVGLTPHRHEPGTEAGLGVIWLSRQ